MSDLRKRIQWNPNAPTARSAQRLSGFRAELVRRRLRVQYTLTGVDLLLHWIEWSVQVPTPQTGRAALPILEPPAFKLTRCRWAEEHLTAVREAR